MLPPLQIGDPRGIKLVRGFGKRLCPDCGWVNLWLQNGGHFRCDACGWSGSAEQCDAPAYVLDAISPDNAEMTALAWAVGVMR